MSNTKATQKRFLKKIGMVFRINLQEDGAYAYGQVATDVDNIFLITWTKKDSGH